ncbi:plasmid stabilization protein [Streptomyces sp. NPDC001177]
MRGAPFDADGRSRKRERQYVHINRNPEERVNPAAGAKIAARAVNKERARSAESRTSRNTSTCDSKSVSQRGVERRPHQGAEGPTKDQMYGEVKEFAIKGRSFMNKQQLYRALGR